MNSKEYKMPDGRTALFFYDEDEIGKISLEAMDLLMSMITEKWIPVSERLPEIGEVVLLTIHEIGWNGCEYDCVVSGVYNSNKNHILAWMPLPEPYVPQESEDKE